MDVKPKRFLVIPHDALNVLSDRHASLEEACDAAKERCLDDGQRMHVVELKAVAAKEEPPVTLRKFK